MILVGANVLVPLKDTLHWMLLNVLFDACKMWNSGEIFEFKRNDWNYFYRLLKWSERSKCLMF